MRCGTPKGPECPSARRELCVEPSAPSAPRYSAAVSGSCFKGLPQCDAILRDCPVPAEVVKATQSHGIDPRPGRKRPRKSCIDYVEVGHVFNALSSRRLIYVFVFRYVCASISSRSMGNTRYSKIDWSVGRLRWLEARIIV